MSLIEKETYEGESEDRKRVNKAKWKEVKKKTGAGGGGSAKTFPQTESYVEHMDGFNPVMVRLMSRPLACLQLAQTFLFSVRDNRHRFVLMMDDRAKRTPNHPLPPQPHKQLECCYWNRLLTPYVARVSDWSDVSFPQALLRSAGCAAGTAAAPSTRTRAWGWRSPSPTNQGTSKLFHSVRLVYKKKRKRKKYFPAVRFSEIHMCSWVKL